MKSCENCYWCFKGNCIRKVELPINGECGEYGYECSSCNHSRAKYKQGEFYHCQDCFLEVNGIESFTVTHYTWDGEYMGSEDDMEEVIECVIENIEEEVVIL